MTFGESDYEYSNLVLLYKNTFEMLSTSINLPLRNDNTTQIFIPLINKVAYYQILSANYNEHLFFV